MAALPPIEAMKKLIENLEATETNAELLLKQAKVISSRMTKECPKRQTGLTGFTRLNQKGTSFPLFLIL
jgi:hypothetical protein